MANGLLDLLGGAFGTAPPDYMQGLLGADAMENLRKRSIGSGLVNALIGYAAMPKNQNLGLGRILAGTAQAGIQGARGVYDQATQDYLQAQKIAEMQLQKEQRSAFDVAAKDLYTTTPAQYRTEQVSGGGYLPQTPDANAIAPTYNLSNTYAPPTTKQVMTAPAKTEMNQNALSQMMISGDPRAASYFANMKALKDINATEKRKVFTGEDGSIRWEDTGELASLENVAKPSLGTTKTQDYEYYANQEKASGRAPKSFGDWDISIESSKAPRSTTNTVVKLPPREQTILDVDQETLKGLTGSANASRTVAAQTRTINSLIGNQEGTGLIKLSADVQNYLGIKSPSANVNAATNAIATVAATGIRTPGSGSTSDLEFNAYRSVFPTLATSKEGRELMAQIADANAKRMSKLADWGRINVGKGTFSYEGLAAYDDSLGKAVSVQIANRVNKLSRLKNEDSGWSAEEVK